MVTEGLRVAHGLPGLKGKLGLGYKKISRVKTNIQTKIQESDLSL